MNMDKFITWLKDQQGVVAMALAAVLFEIPVKFPRPLKKCRGSRVELIDGILLTIEKLLGHKLRARLLA